MLQKVKVENSVGEKHLCIFACCTHSIYVYVRWLAALGAAIFKMLFQHIRPRSHKFMFLSLRVWSNGKISTCVYARDNGQEEEVAVACTTKPPKLHKIHFIGTSTRD